MKKLLLSLSVLMLTAPALAAPKTVKGSEQNLVRELLGEYGSCTNAGEPEMGAPGYSSDTYAVVFICKKDGNGAFGGIDTLTYEVVSFAQNGNALSWIKLD